MKIKSGFTIIELIIVIAVISLLSGIILINMQNVANKNKIARANTDANSIAQALTLFYAKYGGYPSNREFGCGELDDYCDKRIQRGYGDPYLEVKVAETGGGDEGEEPIYENAYLSEFYKLNFNEYSAKYFLPTAEYYVQMWNDYDNKPVCGYVRLQTVEHVYGDKQFIGSWDECFGSTPRPFSIEPYW